MEDEALKAEFWKRFLRAARTEPRPAQTIRGASGIDHPVLALGVDDPGKRLVLISADHDARGAAMMQVDVAATAPGTHVLVARPIAIALPALATALIGFFGQRVIDLKRIAELTPDGKPEPMSKLIDSVMPQVARALKHVDLLPQLLHALKQLSYIEVKTTTEGSGTSATVNLGPLATSDLIAIDRALGVCALPLYTFSDTNWQAFENGNPDDVEAHLKQLGIFQYFFPPRDHVALGLIDKGGRSRDEIASQVAALPSIGHPFGESEIVQTATMLDVIDELESKKLTVEGEFGLEVSETGRSVRATVRFKPREGVISKLLNKLGLNINIHN